MGQFIFVFPCGEVRMLLPITFSAESLNIFSAIGLDAPFGVRVVDIGTAVVDTAVVDTGVDTGGDTGVGTDLNTGLDTGLDTGPDTGLETGVDAT